MKQTGLTFIVLIFVLSVSFQSYSKDEMSPEKMKNIRGQAGVFWELGEIFIKIRYGDISYTDTDGYGSAERAGIKVRYDGTTTTLEFKPIKKYENYSKEKFQSFFGKDINVGLTNLAPQSNDNAGESLFQSDEILIPVSNLSIHTTSLCSTLTALNLYNKGLLQNYKNLPLEQVVQDGNSIGGIKVSLPSVETAFGGRQNDIVLFNAESPNGISNNGKVLFTIQWGQSRVAILGGKIEIKPNE